MVLTFFEDFGSFDLYENNFQNVAESLKTRGQQLYMLGITNTQNSPTEISRQSGDMIELNDIYHERSNLNENIIYINKDTQAEFETSESGIEVNHVLKFKDFKTGSGDFKATFKAYMMSRTNAIILFGSHYVAVVRSSRGFLYVDSLPLFKFSQFNRFENLVDVLSSTVGVEIYTLHCVHVTASSMLNKPVEIENTTHDSPSDCSESSSPSDWDESEECESALEDLSEENESEESDDDQHDINFNFGVNEIGDPIIDDSFDVNILKGKPIVSKVMRKRGVCAFEKCRERASNLQATSSEMRQKGLLKHRPLSIFCLRASHQEQICR